MFPNRMLDTSKEYADSPFLDSIPKDFVLEKGDEFELFVLPERGYNLIEPQIIFEDNERQTTGVFSLRYYVSQNGEANIPIVGFVKLAGMTELEAEKYLQGIYINNYTDPFVNLNILTPKTVTVYRGGGEAKQVILTRPNMTILEVIAAAGGVPTDARPSKIKVMRQKDNQTMVQEIDLSEIDGLTEADNFVRPNDVIYIEPGINSQFFQEIAPIISAVSGIVIIYAYFTNINSN